MPLTTPPTPLVGSAHHGGSLFWGAAMQFAKPPTSIPEQIAQLQARGMIISDAAAAAHYLSHISYYRLTAYWLGLTLPISQSPYRSRA